ncbi:MAG: GGDEF domain-containing protein [Betaproteobacteria bacterium]|nr:GGDEF domain-containing protein [Betaproteobacteria bacterium]
MRTKTIFDPVLSSEELRGSSRTVAEIEWLLLLLVLLFQTVMVPDQETSAALAMSMFFFAAFVLSFRYANFYRQESHWKIAIETGVMIVFITWVLFYTGGAESPLADLYLLVVIVSALTLGKVATLLEMALITGCYIWLGYPQRAAVDPFSLQSGTVLVAQVAPMLLVAYITTMLSADIRRAYGHMKLLSETDELTGVLNMRAFTAVSDRVFHQAARYARPFSVLMIDSDSLKTVNDLLGHEAGNRLLKMMVQSIQGQLRQTDVLARYGGDEFVVLLPETPCNGAVGVAERIRDSVESAPLTTREKKIGATVSIGVACYPDHGADLETVLERADQAMYASKSAGKNRTTAFSA